MKYFAICDNLDAEMGLRLSGMESALVEDRFDFGEVFDRALQDRDIGIIVLTEGAIALDPERVFGAWQLRRMPLVVTVPGGVSDQVAGRELLAFISEAVGVNLF